MYFNVNMKRLFYRINMMMNINMKRFFNNNTNKTYDQQ